MELPFPASNSNKYRSRNPFKDLNFDLALWQLTYLCISPRRLYRQLYYHKRQSLYYLNKEENLFNLDLLKKLEIGGQGMT